MSFVDKVEARSSVELNDSCNCTYCCPRACCFPFGRKIVKHEHPEESSGHIDITATGIRVISESAPQLTQSGKWELDISGSPPKSMPNLGNN